MDYLCNKGIYIDNLNINKIQIVNAIKQTNNYLTNISKYFEELEIEIFHILGQRNISGFIGEVFSRFLEKEVRELKSNPHQDGRPDLINLSSQESINFFLQAFSDKDLTSPVKEKFTPYPFGGVEIKCSIGDSRTVKKEVKEKFLFDNYGVDSFDVNVPRIDFFRDITYWAHHQDCTSLLGIYYDYYHHADFNPQIISIFYSPLNKNDWYELSVGKKGSKKTSNTSLTPSGKQKMKDGIIAIINDEKYINALGTRGYRQK